MLRSKRDQGGFTLIELMVVMAVLAVLSGIVVSGVSGVGTQSKKTTITSDQQIVQSAVDRFYSDSDPQLYPVANAEGEIDQTTANTPPSTGERIIDFNFPLFSRGTATAITFVPHYLKSVPASVDRVTWKVRFPQAEVFYTGDPTAATTQGRHPDALK